MVTSASGVFCFVRNSCDPDGVMFRANGGGAGEPESRRGDSPETFSGARGAEGDDAIGTPGGGGSRAVAQVLLEPRCRQLPHDPRLRRKRDPELRRLQDHVARDARRR